MRPGILQFVGLFGGIEQAASPVRGIWLPAHIPLGLQPHQLPRRCALVGLQPLAYLRLRDARPPPDQVDQIKFRGADPRTAHRPGREAPRASGDFGNAPLRRVQAAHPSIKMIYQLIWKIVQLSSLVKSQIPQALGGPFRSGFMRPGGKRGGR